MKKWRIPLIAFFLIILFNSGAAFEKESITPGVSIGKIRLGVPVSQVIQLLGRPEIDPISENEIDYFVYYDRHKVVIGVLNSTKSVIEVAAYSPYYRLSNGICVSSTKDDVEKAYGKGVLKSMRGNQLLTYPKEGLAFVLDDNMVIAIGVREKGFHKMKILVPK